MKEYDQDDDERRSWLSAIKNESINSNSTREERLNTLNTVPIEQKSSYLQAIMNLFKGYMGVGILALPASFNQGGYILSSFILVIIGIISYKTIALLFKVSNLYTEQNVTYQTIAEKELGYQGLITIRVLLFVFQGGCCVSYIIFFVNFFESAFASPVGEVDYDLLYILLALAIILPLTMIENVKTLSKFSTFANILIVMTLFAVMGLEINILRTTDCYEQNKSNKWNFSKVPMMFGVAIYSFEAIGVVFSIRNSMEKKSAFDKIYFHSNYIIALIFVCFSVLGVLTFGKSMNDIILFALPNMEIRIFQISYAIALALTYPLQIFPVFKILEEASFVKDYLRQSETGMMKRQFIVRFLLTLCFCIIALFVPTFALFLNVVGGVAGTSLQFLFPVLILYCKYGDKLTQGEKFENFFYFALGSFVVIFTILESLHQIFVYSPY